MRIVGGIEITNTCSREPTPVCLRNEFLRIAGELAPEVRERVIAQINEGFAGMCNGKGNCGLQTFEGTIYGTKFFGIASNPASNQPKE